MVLPHSKEHHHREREEERERENSEEISKEMEIFSLWLNNPFKGPDRGGGGHSSNTVKIYRFRP